MAFIFEKLDVYRKAVDTSATYKPRLLRRGRDMLLSITLSRPRALARGSRRVDFADKICELTKDFAKGNYYLTDQLNRAALSISTNIAEGNGRYHKADRINFFRISRGSAFECVPILEICNRKGLINTDKSTALKSELEDICKMLSGLINY